MRSIQMRNSDATNELQQKTTSCSHFWLAWRKMNKHLLEAPPLNEADTCQKILWWGTDFKGGDCNLSQQVALSLYNRGMRSIGDLWDSSAKLFKSPQAITAEFSLSSHESRGVAQLCENLKGQFGTQLNTDRKIFTQDTWFGGFTSNDQSEPAFLIRNCRTWGPSSTEDIRTLHTIPWGYSIFWVGQQSRNLILDQSGHLYRKVKSWSGILKAARVAPVERNSPYKSSSAVYYGVVGELENFDPQVWKWKNGKEFSMYSAKTGRDLVGNRTSLKKPVAHKWRHEMEMNFQLKWKENWQDRSQKEAGFMWSMWHQAVATNTWRANFNPAATADYPLCNSSVPETYLHRFYACPFSMRFWLFSFAVIHWVSKGI